MKGLYQLHPCHDICGVSVDHKLYEVVSFKIVRPYKLAIQFNDGLSQVVDLDGVLEGELYGPLKDPALFRRVRLDPDLGNLVWPNGADFDPEILHDWPERRKAMIEAAAEWRRRGPVVTTKRPKGLDDSTRDKSGQIREKRGDTLVSTLRKQFGEDFARGVSGSTKLGTLLRKEKVSSLRELLKRQKKSNAA